MAALKEEVTVDPLVRGYNGPGSQNSGPGPMSDQAVADDINTAYRTRDRTSMTASDILNSVDTTELAALSVAGATEFWRILGMGEVNPFGVEATLMIDLFGVGSTTIAQLKVDRKEPISRARELGFAPPIASDVATDRA